MINHNMKPPTKIRNPVAFSLINMRNSILMGRNYVTYASFHDSNFTYYEFRRTLVAGT